jgi:hypothetical protein
LCVRAVLTWQSDEGRGTEACSQLQGKDATGRQLGLEGFGISAQTFATQTETMECHTPEVKQTLDPAIAHVRYSCAAVGD